MQYNVSSRTKKIGFLSIAALTSFTLTHPALALTTSPAPITYSAFAVSTTSLAQGQTIHISTTVTPQKTIPGSGYVILDIEDPSSKQLATFKVNFSSLTVGKPLVVAGDWTASSKATLGEYSVNANLWANPVYTAWAGKWGVFQVVTLKAAVAPTPVPTPKPTPAPTPAPAPTPTPVTTTSGPKLSAYVGAGNAAGYVTYSKWFGRPVDQYSDGLNYNSWVDMRESVSWLLTQYAKDKQLIIQVPLLAANNSSGTYWADGVQYTNVNYPKGTLADVVSGKLDSHFIYVAQELIKYGRPNAIVRPGWEFNGNWYPWTAAGNPQGFAQAFAHVVTVMRSVPGAKFKFDWNPSLDTNSVNPELAYPGDAYVDYIGEDIYDKSWSQYDKDPTVRWNLHYNGANGIKWWLAFAAEHKKLLSVPEWGQGTAGDNPLFVKNMAAIIKTSVSYANYWDSNAAYAGQIDNGQYPKAAAEMLKDLGGAVLPQ